MHRLTDEKGNPLFIDGGPMLSRFNGSLIQLIATSLLLATCLTYCEVGQGLTGMDSEFSSPLTDLATSDHGPALLGTSSHRFFGMHPFGANTASALSLGAAFRSKAESFDKLIQRLMIENSLSPNLGVQFQGRDGHRQLSYYTAGQVVCNYQALARSFTDASTVILGQIPKGDLIWHSEPNPGFDLAAVGFQVDRIFPDGYEVVSRRPCAFIRNRQLFPAVELTILANEHPYLVWANESEIFDSEARFFDVDGSSRVYASSPAAKSLVDVTLRGLKGDGTLTSSFFTTDPVGTSRATNENSEFYFDPSDPRFAEVSVFTHASLMLSFFKDLGYVGKKPQLILLKVHDTPSNTVNNAEYLPGEGSADGVPRIRIGDGDGEVLQNLPLDIEVVSHEFGHHVVFDYLKSTKGPSLTVHEAFADFFTLARNDDPCLAESVCPSTALAYPQGACWIAGKCLRTADNTLKLNDPIVAADGHRRGQVVSGLLWDLRSLYSIPKGDVTKIAFTAVNYFPETISFTDLIVALMSADKEVMGGKYSCAILAAAKERGFGESVEALTCSGPLYSKAGKEVQYSDRLINIGSENDPPGEERKIVCAAIGNPTSSSTSVMLLLLLALPIFIGLPKPQKAKAYKRVH